MRDFGGADESPIPEATPTALDDLDLAAGSMGPKVAAAAAFVRASGNRAGIGRLADARAILEGRAGTRISDDEAACDGSPAPRPDPPSAARSDDFGASAA